MDVVTLRVVRPTENFNQMKRFYQGILEMRCINSWRRRDSKGAILSPGRGMANTTIEIIDDASLPVRRGQPKNVELSLEVRDVDAWYERIRKKKGVDIVKDIDDKPWGHREFTIEDPDKMRITIFTPG